MILRLAAHAMATRFELVLAGDDEPALRGAGDAAIEEIHDWDRRLSRFRSDSALSHLNREAAQRPVRVERPVFELLATGLDVWQATAGALDLTMGRVMERLGFHEPTASADLAAPECGMTGVELDPDALTVHFTRPGISLDLGALGKGHAIDHALQVLREQGVDCALVHAGTSSVGTIGAPADQPQGWKVALGPDAAGAPVVTLRDCSMSVSGGHGRTIERDGQTIGHILDPRTLEPVRNGPSLTCVIGSPGRLAEAWSTALMVLGERPATMPSNLTSVVHERTGGWRVEGSATGRGLVAGA